MSGADTRGFSDFEWLEMGSKQEALAGGEPGLDRRKHAQLVGRETRGFGGKKGDGIGGFGQPRLDWRKHAQGCRQSEERHDASDGRKEMGLEALGSRGSAGESMHGCRWSEEGVSIGGFGQRRMGRCSRRKEEMGWRGRRKERIGAWGFGRR